MNMKHQHQSVTHRVLAAFAVGTMALATACTMKSQEAPPLTGPSEFGTSVTISVSPDVLTQDGASQSLVTIIARDSNGDPLRNVSLRAEISVGGVRADFGTLSARNLVTDNSGRATLVYTAPAATQGGAVDTGTVVDILITPVGSDFNNSTSRVASIRLVPPGIVLPPNGTPVPKFTFSGPTTEDVKIFFDGSISTDDGQIVRYAWSFGDGESASGATVSHAYSQAGSYSVILTVTDDRGLSASSLPQVIPVGAATPQAAFTFTPNSPVAVGTTVNFDATSGLPRDATITRYQWSFGDTATPVVFTSPNPSISHTFTTAGTYTVVLTVFDAQNRSTIATRLITVR